MRRFFQWGFWSGREDERSAGKVGLGAVEIIFQPGEMQEKLARAADLWSKGGRKNDHLLAGKAFYIAQCWQNGARAREMGSQHFDPTINKYLAACRKYNGGDAGWENLLEEKTSCLMCGTSYRYENISVCTRCLGFYCYECLEGHASCPGAIVG